MNEPKDDVQSDIDAMGEALRVISSIPTVHRRVIAWRWLYARVEADIVALRQQEHIERVGDAVEAILGR